MRILIIVDILMIWLTQSLNCGVPTDNDVLSHAFDYNQFDDVVTSYMRERKIPGASLAVSRAGQFLVRKGYGKASRHRLMTPWALIRVGSISKILTSIGILHLCENNLLHLNSTVFGDSGILAEYGNHFTDRRILNVTVRDLLQHTSGWSHSITPDPLLHQSLISDQALESTDSSSNQTKVTRKHAINYMIRQPLLYNSGTHYSYVNAGYTILGEIIEHVTGQRYESYVQSLLKKRGVYRTKIGRTERHQADISEVEYYSRYPNDRIRSIFDGSLASPPYAGFDLTVMDSSLGWISSASDLVRIFEALSESLPTEKISEVDWKKLDRPLLSQETVKEMVRRPSYTNSSIWYGLGVVVEDDGKTIWHSGSLEGSSGVAGHDRQGFTWALLVNCKVEPNDLSDFIRYSIRTVFGSKNRASRMENDASAAPSPNIHWSSEVGGLVESMSADGKYLTRVMVPDYQFSELVTQLTALQYRIQWINAFSEHGQVYFSVTWVYNSEGLRWVVYHDLKSSKYRKRFKARVAQGYRLIHIESYISRKRLKYAAVFVKDSGPLWMAYDGYNIYQHRSEFYRLNKAGYKLVVQSVTEYRGRLYVAALYDKIMAGASRVRLGLSLDEFSAELNKQLTQRRVLSYVQAYEHRGLVKFSAIWTPKTTKYWAVSQSMTKYTLYNKLLEYSNVDMPLVCLTAYHIDDVLHFAALWNRQQ